MAKDTIQNRSSFFGVIVLTLAAVAVGWILAYRQMRGPANSNLPDKPSRPVVSGAMAIAAFSSNIIFNAAAGNSIKVTLRGDVETSSIANPQNGQFLVFLVCQDAVGARLMSWPANVRLAGGAFILSSEPNQCDSISMVYDGIYWHETARTQQIAIPQELPSEESEPLLDDRSEVSSTE